MTSKNGDQNKLRLYADKLGQRHYSLAALRERIEAAFLAEVEGRADILQELDDEPKRRAALSETAEYLLATEYVNLPAAEKSQIIDEALANLFYFGALDPLIRDGEISEISIEGALDLAVRRGFGETQRLSDSPFENVEHLQRLLLAMIAPSGATLREDQPFLELGLKLHQRRARLSIIGPPINPLYSAQLRLHPAQQPRLEDLLTEGGMLPPNAAEPLQNIIESGAGLIITGAEGTGKTSLLGALLKARGARPDTMLIERAAELDLPDELQRTAAVPPTLSNIEGMSNSGLSFEEQIYQALNQDDKAAEMALLALDEIRGDESAAFWAALGGGGLKGLWIAFRGTDRADRLHSALSIAIRKHDFGLDAGLIDAALLDKLPYVAALRRPKSRRPHLAMLGRWVQEGDRLRLNPILTWDGV